MATALQRRGACATRRGAATPRERGAMRAQWLRSGRKAEARRGGCARAGMKEGKVGMVR